MAIGRGLKNARAYRGFSLVELLVVVSIIMLLISLLLPALGGVRKQTRVTICANNEKQIGTALQVYAVTNQKSMPYHTDVYNGNWMWDMTHKSTDLLAATGNNKFDIFYCPTNELQNAKSLWTFSGTFRVLGYFFAIKRANGPMSNPAWSTFADSDRPWVRWASTAKLDPATQELVVDAIISTGGNFSHIKGGWATPHKSAHLEGDTPLGGNILTLDLHVEWRDFEDMALQYWGPEHWF